MPTRQQVLRELEHGRHHVEAARRLGVPPGQAYLIATGLPADGGDVPGGEQERSWTFAGSQCLVNPREENPTAKESVAEWVRHRVERDEQLLEAARRRTAEPPPVREPEATDDVVVVLTREHNRTKVLAKQLETLPGHRTGGTATQLSMRKEIVDMTTAALSRHESVEEQHLWPFVREVLSDGDSWADEGLYRGQQSKSTLARLSGLKADTDEFDDAVEELVLRLRRHVAHQERLFTQFRQRVPQQRLDELGRRLTAASGQ